MAVSPITLEGNMDPVVTGFIMLPYQLVEQAVFEKMFYPLTTDGDGWEVKVSSFTFHVLAGGNSSCCSVEGRATVTATDVDGLAVPLAQGLQDVLAEAAEVGDDLCLLWVGLGQGVVDVTR